MKKVRFVIFVLLALAIPTIAQAQQLNRNKVQWSIDIMPVGGSLYDSGRIGGAFAGVDAAVTAMVIPQVGFRVGLQAAYLAGPKGNQDWKFGDKAVFAPSMTVDVLWDIRNTFSKGSDIRYNIQPFFRFSTLMGTGSDQLAMSVGLGAGIRQLFKINRRIGIVWDMNAVISSDNAWHNQEPGKGKILFAQSGVGINYAF